MSNHKIIMTQHVYPNKAFGKVGKCYKSDDNKYFYQRKSDVLFVNSASLLVSSNPVGFLEGRELTSCKFEEFIEVLNDTIFKMNILNGEFKIKE